LSQDLVRACADRAGGRKVVSPHTRERERKSETGFFLSHSASLANGPRPQPPPSLFTTSSLTLIKMAGPTHEYAAAGRHPVLEAGYRVSSCFWERGRHGERRRSIAPAPTPVLAAIRPFRRACSLPTPQAEDAGLCACPAWRGTAACAARPTLLTPSDAPAAGAALVSFPSLTLFRHRTSFSASHAPELGLHRLYPGRRHGWRAGEFHVGGGKVREHTRTRSLLATSTLTSLSLPILPPPFVSHPGRRLRHQLGLEVQQQGQAVRGLRGSGHDRRGGGRGGMKKRRSGWVFSL